MPASIVPALEELIKPATNVRYLTFNDIFNEWERWRERSNKSAYRPKLAAMLYLEI
jgi:hypothetical protein